MIHLRLLLSLIVLTASTILQAAPSNAESERIGDALFSGPELLENKLSPDGVYMASIGYYKGARSIYVINLATKKFSVVTVNKDEDISDYFWVDNDQIVYNVNKWEMYTLGLSVHSMKRGKSERIFTPWDTKLYFAGMVDPLKRIAGKFVFKATPGGPPDLYIMDIASKNFRRLASNTGNITEYMVDQEGQPFRALETKDGKSAILSWNGSGWDSKIAGLDPVTPLGMLPGDKFLLTEAVNDTGLRGINLLDLESGKYSGEPRFLQQHDLVTYPVIDNLSGKVIGVRFDRDKPGNFWFDSAVRSAEQAIRSNFGGYNLEYLGYSAGAKISYFIASRDSMPPVVIALQDGNPTPGMVYQPYPKTMEMDFRPTEPVSFKSKDGKQDLHGYLTKPAGEGSAPTIVLLHGGPFERDVWDFNPVVQYLALHGYNVLQVNYRGSKGYGYGYSLNGLAEVALVAVDDVIAGIEMLKEKGIAAPGKIAIMGERFGGLIATGVAAKAPDACNAVIAYGTAFDLISQREDDLAKDVDWLAAQYDNYNEELFRKISPVNMVNSIDASVLLMHSKDDKRVSQDQAKSMEKALKGAGKKVDTFYVDWGTHGLPREKERIKFMETVGSFLESAM